MKVKILSADVCLNHQPKSGKQAYKMLIQSMNAEIKEKQDILAELQTDSVRKKFIESWSPNARSVNIFN